MLLLTTTQFLLEGEPEMSSNNFEHIRAIARSLKQRLESDTHFREQIEEDPVKVLIDAGLPEDAIPDFLQQTGISEVSGYMYCGVSEFFE